jgi:hypothetical protein
MELLEEIGIAHKILEKGIPVIGAQARNEIGEILAEFHLELLKGVTKHPYVMVIPQVSVEILSQKIDNL